jgi:hypothetical protein
MRYKCSNCEYESHLIGNVKAHLNKKIKCYSGEIPEIIRFEIDKIKCDKCDNFLVDIKRHKCRERENGRYSCSTCKYTTDHILNMKRHINKKNKCYKDDESIINKINLNIKCNECKKTFVSIAIKKKHDKICKNKHTDFKYEKKKCNICNVFFANVKQHMSNIHNIDVKWFNCEKCDYKCKTSSDLEKHNVNLHYTDIKLFNCEKCNYKSKLKDSLKKHMKNKHDIDVKWYNCKYCDYKTKASSDLSRHKQNIHDIGNHLCNYCLGNKNSSINYEGYKICRKCYNKRTGKSTRSEYEWSEYLDKNFGTEFLLSSDKRIHGNKCQYYRPDKIYASSELIIHKECDEHEHKYNNGNYECDEKRISDIYDEFENKNTYIVTRWNPDNYIVPKEKKRLYRKERLELDLYITKKIQENQNKFPKLFIFFICYSKNSQRLTKNIPFVLIYDKIDVDDFINKLPEIGVNYGANEIKLT